MSGLPLREYVAGPTLLKDVRLVDPETGCTAGRPSDVLLEKGCIGRIADAGALEATAARLTIEGRSRFALPGLIDCHVHICGIFITELPGLRDFRWLLRQVSLNHRAQLQSGVTLARDMMSALRAVLWFRKRAKDPCSGFPRVLCAGPMLTVQDGYPPYIPDDRFYHRILGGPLKLKLRDAQAAASWIDRLADAGVDWIKVGYQGALFDTARTPMKKPSPALFRTIVDRAHHHGLPVAVHHYWIDDLHELLDLPFDTLEHITEDGELEPQTLDRMAERGLPVTTDLEQSAFAGEPQKYLDRIERGVSHLLPRPKRDITRLLREVAAGEDIQGLRPRQTLMELAFVKDLVDQKSRNLKLMADHGILIGAGSDSGVHMMMGILPEELCRMANAGLSNARVLRSATVDAAKLLRVDDAGRIREGCRADFVLYERDPLQDITAVRRPTLVIRDGVPHVPKAS